MPTSIKFHTKRSKPRSLHILSSLHMLQVVVMLMSIITLMVYLLLHIEDMQHDINRLGQPLELHYHNELLIMGVMLAQPAYVGEAREYFTQLVHEFDQMESLMQFAQFGDHDTLLRRLLESTQWATQLLNGSHTTPINGTMQYTQYYLDVGNNLTVAIRDHLLEDSVDITTTYMFIMGSFIIVPTFSIYREINLLITFSQIQWVMSLISYEKQLLQIYRKLSIRDLTAYRQYFVKQQSQLQRYQSVNAEQQEEQVILNQQPKLSSKEYLPQANVQYCSYFGPFILTFVLILVQQTCSLPFVVSIDTEVKNDVRNLYRGIKAKQYVDDLVFAALQPKMLQKTLLEQSEVAIAYFTEQSSDSGLASIINGDLCALPVLEAQRSVCDSNSQRYLRHGLVEALTTQRLLIQEYLESGVNMSAKPAYVATIAEYPVLIHYAIDRILELMRLQLRDEADTNKQETAILLMITGITTIILLWISFEYFVRHQVRYLMLMKQSLAIYPAHILSQQIAIPMVMPLL